SKPVLLTDTYYPRIEVVFGGGDSFRESLIVDADEFIGVKSFKAKGKRLSTFTVEKIQELEPVRFPEEPAESASVKPVEIEEEEEEDASVQSNTDIEDEIAGQMKLFD
ncbi:MAG: DNA gyrase/topoisomerase IV subunit A, partial [Bacteroidota bacterium]|nr:DNA gyrase/topoisomerase IV subunit A [Bacteroidota bacterium]